MADDDWFSPKGNLTFELTRGFALLLEPGEAPMFRPPLVLMTPAELRALKASPERWSRYQAFLAATAGNPEKLSGG